MRFATKTKELSSWRDREPCNIMMTMDATMCRSKVDTSAIFKRFLWSSYFRRNEWRNYEVREYEYKLKMQISIKKLQWLWLLCRCRLCHHDLNKWYLREYDTVVNQKYYFYAN